MNIRMRGGILLPLLAVLLAPGLARAGDFIDTRVSFTLGDDNFFKDSGEQIPNSPTFGIGDRPGYELPMDNLNRATTGRENELHLVLYKNVPGILPGLTTEVAAAMAIDMSGGAGVFRDDSSYIRLVYALDPAARDPHYIDLTLFPLSGDRFRAGYLYDLTWGGADMFPDKAAGVSPGFKLGGNHGMLYWWGGMKMVLSDFPPDITEDEHGMEQEVSMQEMLYSVLAGVGYQPVPGLSIDFSGAHLQQAKNYNRDVLGETVTATGLSGRVAYGRGLAVALSSDLRLIRNDREYLERLHLRPVYNPAAGVSWAVSLEGNAIGQVLADPDRLGATKRQWASAGALDARMQYGFFRLNLTGVYRSLEFSLLGQPAFVPYTAFSNDVEVQPQWFGAVSADYHFSKFGITPGLQLGIELPGGVETELYEVDLSSGNPVSTLVGRHTILLRSTGERVILPEGEGRVPVYSARLTTQWWASSILTLEAFLLLIYDENATNPVPTPGDNFTWAFDDPLRIGAGITAQARF